MGWDQLQRIVDRARERAREDLDRADEHRICPNCSVRTVTRSTDGVIGCTFCGWSEN